MLRIVLLAMLMFIVWRLARIFSRYSQRPRDPQESIPPFINIQDAEFEDVTKSSSESATSSQDR